MAGIYIHIPFCRQACRYCDFFFSVSLRYVDTYVDCLVREIERSARAWSGKELETIYLGGGTPSVLSKAHLKKILGAVQAQYNIRPNVEQTIECNPDDLKPSYLKELRDHGFNRISIGIQSFQEKELELMRRSHLAAQAEQSVMDAAEAGFDNITMDLIYGIPGQSLETWESNLEKALSLPISHLSAYHLTFEPGTIFDHWRKKGKVVPVHEEESVHQYGLLRKNLMDRGFDHYEISNFAREGSRSRHNMLYWSGQPYLGFGPSAHSYDGSNRSWNVSSLKIYMEGVVAGKGFSEAENLSNQERYHDYLITSLRTRWGADPEHIIQQFGNELFNHFSKKSKPFLDMGYLLITNGHMAIDPDHWLITDYILRELFF